MKPASVVEEQPVHICGPLVRPPLRLSVGDSFYTRASSQRVKETDRDRSRERFLYALYINHGNQAQCFSHLRLERERKWGIQVIQCRWIWRGFLSAERYILSLQLFCILLAWLWFGAQCCKE